MVRTLRQLQEGQNLINIGDFFRAATMIDYNSLIYKFECCIIITYIFRAKQRTSVTVITMHDYGIANNLPELLELVSLGEVFEADIYSNLSSCINFTLFSFVMAYTIIINTLVAYLDVILLFVSQTSTFDSPNSLI